ncbi:hypothetical protein K435DRAFT_479079 [Dendrothele bispora CBS 962.96]|uniref:Uncharacterized protein n=1 Tax=Dendrothele bispora (strain CBS 962.96) TaxID=1314807 RepID=A0A4S8MTC1_DENBC|nr:hypothetical protein K435DRAFT_479079 [Dendrothele bispora CBS 962.96]
MGLQNQSFDVQDSDLRFEGPWNASSVPGSPTGTLKSSNDRMARVTFTFPTPANAFYYYGMSGPQGGQYAICIDCDPNKPEFKYNTSHPQDNGDGLPLLLFSQTFTDFRVHEVILENRNNTRGAASGNSQITIDRFEIQVEKDSVSAADDVSTSSDVSSTAFPPAPSPLLLSSSSPPSSSSPNAPSRNRLVGPIVGGIIGMLFLLCLLVLFVMQRRYIRHQRRRLRSSFVPFTPGSPSISDHDLSDLRQLEPENAEPSPHGPHRDDISRSNNPPMPAPSPSLQSHTRMKGVRSRSRSRCRRATQGRYQPFEQSSNASSESLFTITHSYERSTIEV